MTSERNAKQPDTSSQRTRHGLSPGALRASFLLPVAITAAIWLVGLLVYALTPTSFHTAVSFIIGISLFVFLFFYTRNARTGTRILALLFAIPAVAGIAASLVTGSARYLLIGVAITFVLLVVQRFLETPISYRTAYRYFTEGNTGKALEMVDKAIKARPDFWESYQLRALLHLMHLHFAHAERDAKKALALKPGAHPARNTLGQIYLAQKQFEQAATAYKQALKLKPDNAIYHYHLGLSLYRQQKHRAAAESFNDAIRHTLPFPEYDLLAHYYLGSSMEALGEEKTAAEAYEQMTRFEHGLEQLQQQIEQQPDYPHLTQMRTDVADLETRLQKT